MEVIYPLILYGIAALILFFIGSIVAGMILGTFLLVASVVQRVRGDRPVRAAAAADRSREAPSKALV